MPLTQSLGMGECAMQVTPYFFVSAFLWQPTTLCNLRCAYCYLPHTSRRQVMDLEVVERVAQSIEEVYNSKFRIEESLTLIWHGGEPLTLGVTLFERLVQVFEPLRKGKKLRHSIVTNATLINKDWIDLFRKYEFEVGVSLDGPEELNKNRVDISGRNAFKQTVRGIEALRLSHIPFYVLVTLTPDSLGHAAQIYEFIASLKPYMIGFNFLEKEGVQRSVVEWDHQQVLKFWKDLYRVWRSHPVVPIREFGDFYKVTFDLLRESNETTDFTFGIDLLPTINWQGDVTLVSPELSTTFGETDRFKVGNLKQQGILEILQEALRESFLQDYLKGVERCASECPYFDFCLGGKPAHKYFENGDLTSTVTQTCLVSRQLLVEALLQSLN